MSISPETIGTITAVITTASAVSAALPAPRTRIGKVIRRVIDALALNLGNAKNRYDK